MHTHQEDSATETRLIARPPWKSESLGTATSYLCSSGITQKLVKRECSSSQNCALYSPVNTPKLCPSLCLQHLKYGVFRQRWCTKFELLGIYKNSIIYIKMNIFDIFNTLILLYRYARWILALCQYYIFIYSPKKRENYILKTTVSSASPKRLTLTYFHLPNMRFWGTSSRQGMTMVSP